MRLGVVTAALVAAASGCGNAAAGDEAAPLTVAAATSLKVPLTRCAEGRDVRLAFGGSDLLAGRIRQGASADVLAAANTELPAQLAAEGRLEPPTTFAANELVLAVPRDNPAEVGSLADLERDGVTTVLGSRTVPVGTYAREVLERAGIEPDVASEEPDVAGVVGKLVQEAADAGLVYRTDVRAAAEHLATIELPAELQPAVAYAAAPVTGTKRAGRARAYVEGLRRGPCAEALRAAGFLPPP